MLTTKRNPSTVGEIPTQEFMEPLGLTQGAPADAVGVQRKHVNEWCNGRRLNIQRRSDLQEAMNSPGERKRIERAKPIGKAA